LRNPDKTQLRADILAMRANGMSCRKIGSALGIHWTRVTQTVKSAEQTYTFTMSGFSAVKFKYRIQSYPAQEDSDTRYRW
jgi:hypothetical protein